jgi:hypothetical protein
MVKLKATELAKHASLQRMQMMGGYGYATEYGMEELVRSTLVGTIVGGQQSAQAADEGARHTVRRPGQSDELQPRQQFGEDRDARHARQGRTQTASTPGAEAQVVVGV